MGSDKTSLGDRMKRNYENITRSFLPRRTNTIIRLDGKAFHTLTKNLNKPFDQTLMNIMENVTLELCKQIQGVKFAYTQSDEISLLLTDYDELQTEGWFTGNIQKMVSVSAAIATAKINSYSFITDIGKPALFDSRVFTIPEQEEVINYFIWRQQDWTRNSINMLGQSLYSHKELQGKNSSEVQELTFQKGQNWNDLSTREKRGISVKYVNEKWNLVETPIFTKDREFIRSVFPNRMPNVNELQDLIHKKQ